MALPPQGRNKTPEQVFGGVRIRCTKMHGISTKVANGTEAKVADLPSLQHWALAQGRTATHPELYDAN